jgi:glycosyltransferase involved in cell wall biosynthesis
VKVSVIIPTYCRAALLEQAIASVRKQDFEDYEIIVVDDGSTDDTRDRIREFGDEVRYIYQNNQGLSAARNKGLSAAKGEYIALLDDDDWWMPGKLRLQVQILDKLPELAGVFTNFSIHRGPDKIIRNGIQTWYETPMHWENVMDRTLTVSELIDNIALVDSNTLLHIGSLYQSSLDRYFVLPSTAMFRRSSIPSDALFPTHDSICGDWEFFARLSKEAPLCFVDYDTTFNRSHSDAHRLTSTKARRQMELRVDFLERIYRRDVEFYRQNRNRVDEVWKDRLTKLCTLQLLDSDSNAARITAEKFKRIGGSRSLKQRLVLLASSTPGAAKVMRLARAAKRRL